MYTHVYSSKIHTCICAYNWRVEVCASLGIWLNNFDHRRNKVRRHCISCVLWEAGAEMEMGTQKVFWLVILSKDKRKWKWDWAGKAPNHGVHPSLWEGRPAEAGLDRENLRLQCGFGNSSGNPRGRSTAKISHEVSPRLLGNSQVLVPLLGSAIGEGCLGRAWLWQESWCGAWRQ